MKKKTAGTSPAVFFAQWEQKVFLGVKAGILKNAYFFYHCPYIENSFLNIAHHITARGNLRQAIFANIFC